MFVSHFSLDSYYILLETNSLNNLKCGPNMLKFLVEFSRDHLFPLLFNIFINTICSQITPCCVLLFANDVKIFSLVPCINDFLLFKYDLTIRFYWCYVVELLLNLDKYKIVAFSKSGNVLSFEYQMNHNTLSRVTSVVDLGICFLYLCCLWRHILILLFVRCCVRLVLFVVMLIVLVLLLV